MVYLSPINFNKDLLNLLLVSFSGADGTDYSVCHLAEVDNDSLNLFGRSALDAIDRNWGEKTSSSVSTITFKYIDFEAIVPHLAKLHSRFSNFQVLYIFKN